MPHKNKFALRIYYDENEHLHVWAVNRNMPQDLIVMQLKALVAELKEEYNNLAAERRTFVNIS